MNTRPGEFVADFIGETNFLPGTVAGLEQGMVDLEVDGGGRVRVAGRGELGLGQPATLAVRPERMLVGTTEGGDDWNHLPGVVEEIVFTGATTIVLVRGPAGHPITIRRSSEHFVERGSLQRGAAVVVSWRNDAGSVFPGGRNGGEAG